MQMKAGMKLYSATCDAAFLLIRGAGELDLACGGYAMVPQAPNAKRDVVPDLATGTATGKRYQSVDETVELLCVKGGNGTPTLAGEPLEIKATKALPSSD